MTSDDIKVSMPSGINLALPLPIRPGREYDHGLARNRPQSGEKNAERGDHDESCAVAGGLGLQCGTFINYRDCWASAAVTSFPS